MQSSDIPPKFQIPFANAAGAGYIRPIPKASQIGVVDGAASLTDGFPPVTFQQLASGGVPPFGQDFNGLLNQMTAWERWAGAGGPVNYDAVFQAAIGGYPKGAQLLAANGSTIWISATENNMTNPDAGGAGWVTLTSISAPNSFKGNNTALQAPQVDLSVSQTLAMLGFSSNLAQNGSYVFPAGMAVVWGRVTLFGATPFLFQRPFASACYAIVASPIGRPGSLGAVTFSTVGAAGATAHGWYANTSPADFDFTYIGIGL